jgi:glycosyltransferase involved in cell wall biosynthesis
MAQARAIVVPSHSEAFGIVALEAWRSSAALIMTSRGGASEFVSDGVDGLLVDPEDLTTLAQAMRVIASDEALRERLATAGSKRVCDFTWRRVAEEYLQLYATKLHKS